MDENKNPQTAHGSEQSEESNNTHYEVEIKVNSYIVLITVLILITNIWLLAAVLI